MTRKTYYYILSISFILIALYSVLDAFVLSGMRINNSFMFSVRNITIIFILIYETIHAGKVIRIINMIALPLLFIGLMFILMHWPFGVALFLFPALLVVLGLFTNTLKNEKERASTLLILSIPLFHLIGMSIKIFHYPGAGLVFFSAFILMFITGIVVGIRAYKMS